MEGLKTFNIVVTLQNGITTYQLPTSVPVNQIKNQILGFTARVGNGNSFSVNNRLITTVAEIGRLFITLQDMDNNFNFVKELPIEAANNVADNNRMGYFPIENTISFENSQITFADNGYFGTLGNYDLELTFYYK